MSQTKRVFESAFIPYYTHAPVKVRKQSKVSLHKGIKMTDKIPKFPKLMVLLLFLLLGCIGSGKNCFTQDAQKAMDKYPAADGSMCLQSCQW